MAREMSDVKIMEVMKTHWKTVCPLVKLNHHSLDLHKSGVSTGIRIHIHFPEAHYIKTSHRYN